MLMAILFIILMMGVAPTFAADSSVNQQTVTSTAIKEPNSDISDVYQVTDPGNDDMINSFDASDLVDEDSGYIDGYDDEGYIGNYIVVDPSNLADTSDDGSDETDDYTVDSFDIPGEDSDYIDEYDNLVVNLASIYQFDDSADEFDDDGTDSLDTLNTQYEDVDYIDKPDVNDYIVDESDMSSPPNEENIDELNLNGDEYYIVTELDFELEYGEPFDSDQLNESLDNKLDTNYTADPSDDRLSNGEITPQINTNVSTNCKPLIVTIVNGLRGVVLATLEGVCNVLYGIGK